MKGNRILKSREEVEKAMQSGEYRLLVARGGSEGRLGVFLITQNEGAFILAMQNQFNTEEDDDVFALYRHVKNLVEKRPPIDKEGMTYLHEIAYRWCCRCSKLFWQNYTDFLETAIEILNEEIQKSTEDVF